MRCSGMRHDGCPVRVFALQWKASGERLLQGQVIRGLRSSSSAQTGTGWIEGLEQNVKSDFTEHLQKQTVESTLKKHSAEGEVLIILALMEEKYFLFGVYLKADFGIFQP